MIAYRPPIDDELDRADAELERALDAGNRLAWILAVLLIAAAAVLIGWIGTHERPLPAPPHHAPYGTGHTGGSPMTWTKPARSGANGGCWEVLRADTVVFVRDTKDNGAGPVLEYTAAQYRALVAAVYAGGWPSWVTVHADGSAEVRMPDRDEPVLRFTALEMDAYAGSVRDGQRELQPA